METKKNLTTIYIVRHGQTEHNVKEIVQGQTDSPLTSLGYEQAKNRADDFSGILFDAIFSSDLNRATQTAEILKLNRRLVVNTTRLLREKSYGRFEGKTAQFFRQEAAAGLQKLQKLTDEEKMQFKHDPGMESDEETVARMIIILREIGAAFSGKTILVVSHGNIMRNLLRHLGYAKYDELPGGSVDNLGYIILQTDGLDFFVRRTIGVNINKIE